MKKIISFFFVLMLIFSAKAVDFTGIKIYINPGHGGYNGANDRNVQTIPFALGDTLGFWESASNLTKGLALRDLLQAANATVYMSRTQNREEDDRALSEIAEEANANNVDAFLSIHSNALGTNTGTNYLLLLYHGYDDQPTVAASLPMAQTAWPRLISNQLTVWTHYTTSTNIRGDFSFYGNTSGLGVLRPLTVPGFLSEGSFHDYLPETHRLLNKDYRKLESNNFYRYFCDYFQANLPSTGIIAGFAKSSNEKMNNPLYIYKAFTHDEKVPINGAKVKLMNQNGDSLNVYYVDTLYNGIFAFYNLAPGTYKLHLEAKDYQPKDTTVTVTAASTTYAKMFLPNLNVVIPKDTTPDYPDPIQEAGVLPMKHYNFGDQEVVVPEWLNQQPIKKVLYRDEKLYVLTTEPKITIYNAQSLAKIREMDLSGIESGVNLVSDIAFTSDGYLLACNKDTISLPENKGRYFKVYTWDNDSVAPSLLFKTQQQANWSNGIMGETFAVSGPRWKCTIYVPSVTTGSSKAIRIVGYLYEEGNALGYKYMLDAANYTEALWGKNIKFHISPTGKSHFILDSEKVLPVEYQFDWNAADRSPLIKKGEFSEQNGFNLAVCASGIHFFRHAQHTFMVSPTCDADTTKVGAVLFDVTNGIQQSLKVSEKLPANGLGTAKASYMVAAAKVSGYDLDVMVLAENEGMARFKTISGPSVANIYASELKVEKTETDFILKFTLNENATSVKIDILDGENIIKTIDAGALNKGVQSVPVPLTELPTGSFTWNVTASTEAVDRPVKISDDSRPELQFYSPRGVAVDNNFESPFFGRVYATETVGGNTTNRTTQDGVYILNAALEDITQQGMGITQYPGSGKCHVVAISPITGLPMDNNVGGYFGSFLKFSGFDLLEIQGKAEKDVIIFIDGNEGIVRIEEAPLEEVDSYYLVEALTEMYAHDEDDKKNVSVVSTGTGADNSLIGMLNFSFYDVKRKHTRVKQAGRGGPGTTFRDKKIKALVVRYAGIKADSNKVAKPELIRQAGARINKEIIQLDATNCRMRSIGTVNMIETLNAADVLPVNNYQYGSDDRIHAIESGVWKSKFTQGMFDGCWFGCTLSCAHAVDNYELKTGPLKGEKVIVDGPEYEGVGGLGSNLGCWDADFVIESNFYCDHYGLDNISAATIIAFLMECYEAGIIDKAVTEGLDLRFGNTEAAMELIHKIARGDQFGKIAGSGIRKIKQYLVEHYNAPKQFLQDIGMEVKGLEFSEYMTKESLAQQGGFGMANKGPQHDEAWLIFMDQVKKQLPTFQDKAEALFYFPLFRTWFSLVGLCKLPWNDTEPADNRTKYSGMEAAKVPEHVENYCWLYEGVTGNPLSKEEMIEQSRRVYNFQRMFSVRLGRGDRKDDLVPYRSMGPVTVHEYESRQSRYDDQLKQILNIDPTGKSTEEKIKILRTYREEQYEKLQDAVYTRRGWDLNGIPTENTLRSLQLDFPEVLELLKK